MRLLGVYFHEDRIRAHGTAEGCLDRMVEEASPRERQEAASEIALLLARGLCENQIRDVLLYEVGCAYAFERDGHDASSWLRHVRTRLLEVGR